MFEDSDPRHEFWDEEEEEDEEEEDRDAEEEGNGAGSQGSPGQETPKGLQGRCQDRGPWGLGGDPGRGPPPPPFLSALQNGTGPTDCNGAEASPSSSWGGDIRTICWPTEQALHCPFRTFSHPSFQAFYTAVSVRNQASLPLDGDPASTARLRPKPGPLPSLDCSGFFYTDPTMPPGHRIYNWLSSSSQEVFHNLRLNTPAPVMSTCEATPALPRKVGLSELGHKAASSPLELLASVACSSDARLSSLPGPEEEVEECKKPAPDLFL
ncbi:histone deacetylase complex subunit SAP25 [Sceloporus undulatus]|uniref:histone deacetylase complex subunit SAP25 n=1 Tax=Sceloporus undulatus TaxID=8520 RepID=UPI001C4CC933|nr:histone deacetylase complex subunit SAP25 [Sceloporus undulatus]XP_042331280.1 histone deacetylase complex subunit SAP25 [Sceloporus undulatus]XP_042331281.1 histone deacetylase complex subunit SAP25 [Sceloporus undulatus]XP_042331282.1 histone deacetylase complex subunit SAP25 [Sceloporus undulatus]XP_042331283.1 histone deacetylase complex subunit SAP25 [Sceloporus undulatus]